MLHELLDANRAELTARFRRTLAARSSLASTVADLEHGVPVLIDQLVEVLRGEHARGHTTSAFAPPPGIRRSAAMHGGELHRTGCTVDQVVHYYGDFCHALTALAREQELPISVNELETFHRCLDVVVADAVREFDRQRDQTISAQGAQILSERLGSLAHEQRNLLNTATLAFAALKAGHGAVSGATGAILDRSLGGMRDLIDRALADVRLTTGLNARCELTPVDVILEEVSIAAQLEADARKLAFTVALEHGLAVDVDRPMLSSAIANLLQNAFKFTSAGGHVQLTARVASGHVLIEVADQCGGLPAGKAEELFRPFEQRNSDRSGLGLGLSISRRAVKANGGTLAVRDVPGTGCVFTIDLPQNRAS